MFGCRCVCGHACTFSSKIVCVRARWSSAEQPAVSVERKLLSESGAAASCLCSTEHISFIWVMDSHTANNTRNVPSAKKPQIKSFKEKKNRAENYAVVCFLLCACILSVVQTAQLPFAKVIAFLLSVMVNQATDLWQTDCERVDMAMAGAKPTQGRCLCSLPFTSPPSYL